MQKEFEFTLEQLADESRPVRTINLAHLSDLPRDLAEHFRGVWPGFSPARRLDLVSSFVEQAEANIHLNFHMILRDCLADTDAQVRRLAVEGLWEDERPSLIDPLVTLLAEDPAAEVRAAAASLLGQFVLLGALGEIDEVHAVRAEQALRTAWFRPREVTQVRRRALEGLAYTSEPDVHGLIDVAYFDEDPLMRQSAVLAMGRSADWRWEKFVLGELNSGEAAMRFEAAFAAGELILKAAVHQLIRLLDDVDGDVREAAALALGKIGGRDAMSALQAVLVSGDERLVDAAGDALDELYFNRGDFDDVLMDFRVVTDDDHVDLMGEAWDADETLRKPDIIDSDARETFDWYDDAEEIGETYLPSDWVFDNG